MATAPEKSPIAWIRLGYDSHEIYKLEQRFDPKRLAAARQFTERRVLVGGYCVKV